MLNKNIKNQWINNLLSGDYQQTNKPYLRYNDKYCPEGVLLDQFMKSDDNLFNLIFWTGDGIKQRDKDDNLYIEYWVIPDIVKKTYGYQLQDLLWSDIVRVLGSDHKCVQSMTKKELIVNGRVIVIGQYLSDSIVNIVILNHHGFTFEDIATVILQLI